MTSLVIVVSTLCDELRDCGTLKTSADVDTLCSCKRTTRTKNNTALGSEDVRFDVHSEQIILQCQTLVTLHVMGSKEVDLVCICFDGVGFFFQNSSVHAQYRLFLPSSIFSMFIKIFHVEFRKARRCHE